jgi:hypothetical protein
VTKGNEVEEPAFASEPVLVFAFLALKGHGFSRAFGGL